MTSYCQVPASNSHVIFGSVTRNTTFHFFWLGHGHAAEFAYHAGKFGAAAGSRYAVDGNEFHYKFMLNCQLGRHLQSALRQPKYILTASESIFLSQP
jgi:hypothetical protein